MDLLHVLRIFRVGTQRSMTEAAILGEVIRTWQVELI
jgi:hypothetical protein